MFYLTTGHYGYLKYINKKDTFIAQISKYVQWIRSFYVLLKVYYKGVRIGITVNLSLSQGHKYREV